MSPNPPSTLISPVNPPAAFPQSDLAKSLWRQASTSERITLLSTCGVDPKPDNLYAARWYREMADTQWDYLPMRVTPRPRALYRVYPECQTLTRLAAAATNPSRWSTQSTSVRSPLSARTS